MKWRSRGGFSLLEVLLATSILLACAVVLGELAAIGRRHLASGREMTTAQLLCQNRLNEMLIGALPMVAVEKEELEDAPGWVCTVAIDPTDHAGLSALRVTVAQDVPEDKPTRQFTLVRWVPAADDVGGVQSPSPLGSEFGGPSGARMGGFLGPEGEP
jgi:Tfp pilus assembly protein PilV